MHHFTKRTKKKLWYHVALPFGSALITVALLDMISSLLWFVNDFKTKVPTLAINDKIHHNFLGILEIFQGIYVTYRVVLSLVLCIGGIFMGRRLIVITWLLVSIMVDSVHLSESIYILSKPNFITTWTLFLTATASIWSDIKIIRIKYRIIRRSLTTTSILSTCTMQNESEDLQMEKCDSQELEEIQEETSFMSFKVNLVSLIKLIRNLYNLMTWHLASFYSQGENFHGLLKNNHSAILLEQNFVRYAHMFLDSLTVIYIIQEKKVLLTPWITIWILGASTTTAICIFVMQQFNLLASMFSSIYYLVFSIDLFLRSGFVIYCLQLIIKTRHII